MENGSDNGTGSDQQLNNGLESPTMSSPQTTTETNGVSHRDEDFSDESDVLVIDETTTRKSPANNSEVVRSLIPSAVSDESSQQSTKEQHRNSVAKFNNLQRKILSLNSNKSAKNSQSTVNFKCSLCGNSGFESFTTLTQHIATCTAVPAARPHISNNAAISKTTLREKLYVCGVCGTYCNHLKLYLHMVETHKRYPCLFCLRTFKALLELCLHIESVHDSQPTHHHSTVEDFLKVHKKPCNVICCECNEVFTETDNFFNHTCVVKKQAPVNKVKKNNLRRRVMHHLTGDNEIVSVCDSDSASPEDTEIANAVDTENTNVIARKKLSKYSPEFQGFPADKESEFLDFCRRTLNSELQLSNGSNNRNELAPIKKLKIKEVKEREKEPMAAIEEPVETRKVPKLSLKLKPGSFPEIETVPELIDSDFIESESEDLDSTFDNSDNNSDNNDTISNELPPTDVSNENIDDEEIEKTIQETGSEETQETQETQEAAEETTAQETVIEVVETNKTEEVPEMQVAGPNVPIIDLEVLEQPLDKINIKTLLQKCLNATAPTCIYCNHARKICVNGKQLGLHAISEHRFSAVVRSITAEELIPESFVMRIRDSLEELADEFFSLESSREGVTFSQIFECFQCRYATKIHKELYLHNRKMHTRNLTLCIMCKSNFYTYSEMICHLCPGVYILGHDVEFRCCLCVSDQIPSAFRLLVHLRKRHHACDVCLELCQSQSKLSNHVWKHKLHHFCYRCGIAYRNKPDITRHLFWKHGTESVVCKKCLQKKWPHVYHFCRPPAMFSCEECNVSYYKAISLMVHNRIHTNTKPHQCTYEGCEQAFISKKLLAKHELSHKEVVIEEEKLMIEESPIVEVKPAEEVVPKPKIDLYDLPELNLSESDSSDSESEQAERPRIEEVTDVVEIEEPMDVASTEEAVDNIVLDNIWDDFKNYQANKMKFDHLLGGDSKINEGVTEPTMEEEEITEEIALHDHDYCCSKHIDTTFTESMPHFSPNMDHDYCTLREVDFKKTQPENAKVSERRSSSSSSSSGSTCSCGSNCSCSTSSDSSGSSSDGTGSDSSTEEGRRQQQIRREKRRQKKLHKGVRGATPPAKEEVVNNEEGVSKHDTSIDETDLETTESETDEEFYDKKPHLLAQKMMEEKRNLLLSGIDITANGYISRSATPIASDLTPATSDLTPVTSDLTLRTSDSTPIISNFTPGLSANTPVVSDISPGLSDLEESLPQPTRVKKKSKSKKKKKKKKSEREPPIPQYFYQQQIQLTAPPLAENEIEIDSNVRVSKRRRVPNKFYGYSSDEEENSPPSKWKKIDTTVRSPPVLPPPPPLVPPITIKTPIPQPKVSPTTIRTTSSGQAKVHSTRAQIVRNRTLQSGEGTDTESGESAESGCESDESSNEGRNVMKMNPTAVYCYCKCPYDEVSEMIGCDSRDCEIEWFHFECVGIILPPKGHWYCPECRKKRQEKRQLLKSKTA